MRVLLVNHSPLDSDPAGAQTRQLFQSLAAGGHEAQVLAIDGAASAGEEPAVRRVICQPHSAEADLPFARPQFARQAGGLSYEQLTDEQLVQYRTVLRRFLDVAVDRFNPHVIHAQHVWVLGELVLETGVPYVLSAHGEEFAAYRADPRFRSLAEQAGENAGRILVAASETRAEVLANLEHVARSRVQIVPEVFARDGSRTEADRLSLVAAIQPIYEHVLVERFGRLPE